MEDSGQLNFERRTQAAEGYIELGMFLDANTELEEIEAELKTDLQVLELRLRIYEGLKSWDLMLIFAKDLASHDPDNPHWAVAVGNAARHALSIEAARVALLQAVERIPGSAILHYNLACYECLTGDLRAATARLKYATVLDPDCRLRALDDDDLAPLWAAL